MGNIPKGEVLTIKDRLNLMKSTEDWERLALLGVRLSKPRNSDFEQSVLEHIHGVSAHYTGILQTFTPALVLGTHYKGGLITAVTLRIDAETNKEDFFYSLIYEDGSSKKLKQSEISEEDFITYCEQEVEKFDVKS